MVIAIMPDDINPTIGPGKFEVSVVRCKPTIYEVNHFNFLPTDND